MRIGRFAIVCPLSAAVVLAGAWIAGFEFHRGGDALAVYAACVIVGVCIPGATGCYE